MEIQQVFRKDSSCYGDDVDISDIAVIYNNDNDDSDDDCDAQC